MSDIEIPAVSPAAIRLFACISRFEFALKDAGYVTGPENTAVGVGWTQFETEAGRAGAYDRLSSIEAVQPLFEGPPRKQVRKGSGFE